MSVDQINFGDKIASEHLHASPFMHSMKFNRVEGTPEQQHNLLDIKGE
jgi:hypothetical protein